ncbi:MAG TPA: VOC family protein [Amycolatopsis sp.]|uniref:VOC family protein n=1 Tax=Amycolatopsis nalaikhensis TaxID=715472 RepID=A0ABY8XHM6_9PSEU|nr:VOC family protein [Amycolatopsis sp. 2-2]WIV55119.1 VOC family protein [Amycolatopsis sp. 2-2]
MPAELTTVVLDCADPAALAAFYAKALGWEVTYQDDDTVQLGGGPVGLGFQRVAGYRGPGWPDAAKHAHLDLRVTDLPGAVKEFEALGATKPDFQPGGTDWVVLADPEGHLFCLIPG